MNPNFLIPFKNRQKLFIRNYFIHNKVISIERGILFKITHQKPSKKNKPISTNYQPRPKETALVTRAAHPFQ